MRPKAKPNRLGILPDLVEMTCDFRHPTKAGVERMLDRFKADIAALEATSRGTIAIREPGPVAAWRLMRTASAS